MLKMHKVFWGTDGMRYHNFYCSSKGVAELPGVHLHLQ